MSWLHKSKKGCQNLPGETTFASISKVLNLFFKQWSQVEGESPNSALSQRGVLHHSTGMRLYDENPEDGNFRPGKLVSDPRKMKRVLHVLLVSGGYVKMIFPDQMIT